MAYRFKKKSKSNTVYLDVEGFVSYPKIYEPDEYNGKQFWSVNLHVDKENEAKVKSSGSQVRLKKDGNEEYSGVPGPYYKFRRECEKKIGDELREYNPPEIFDADGKSLVSYDGNEMKGEKILIGNGSKVILTLEIYNTQIGKGTRLRSIKLIDLIKYDPNAGAKDEEKEEVEQEGSENAGSSEGSDTPW